MPTPLAANLSARPTPDPVAGRLAAERWDAVGWGLLLVMTGIVLLVPGLPDGTWLVGFGAILVAVNLARSASGIGAEWLWVIVGAGAMLAGVGAIAGVDLPVVALVLLAGGLALIAGPWLRGERGR